MIYRFKLRVVINSTSGLAPEELETWRLAEFHYSYANGKPLGGILAQCSVIDTNNTPCLYTYTPLLA